MNYETNYQSLSRAIDNSEQSFPIHFAPYLTPKSLNNDRTSTTLDAPKAEYSKEDPLTYDGKQSHHHTLGQMAEQFQERARAAARNKVLTGEGSDDDAGNAGDDSEDEPSTNAHGESTGRWTKQEHELFLEALKKYGKEWKKVASMVKTRTVVQTRTHAQKYFQKLAKSMGSGEVYPSQDEKIEQRPSTQKKSQKKIQDFHSPEPNYLFHDKVPNDLLSRDYADNESRNYFPLESENLRPLTLHASPAGFEAPSLFIPSNIRQDFPQPSPAACGKRKQAELTAAQVLAGSNLEVEGVNVLSAMKRDNEEEKIEAKRLRPSGLSLAFPDRIHDFESDPGTPWESELRALSSKSFPVLPVSTPSEQRQVIDRMRRLILQGDLQGLQELLKAVQNSSRVEHSDVTEFTPTRGSNFRGAVLSKLLNSVRSGDVSLLIEAVLQDLHESVIYDFCKLLLENGISVNATDKNGNTALHLAALRGYEKIGKLLLNKGCSVNATNEEGNAAVHVAALQGHSSMLEMLADLGANFHLRNNNALSPLDLAGQLSQDPGEREVLRRHMFSIEPRLRTLILFHRDFMDHTARRPSDWEGPDRLSTILKKLQSRQIFPDYEVEFSSQFEKADVTLLGRAHSPEYLAFVNDLSKRVQADNVTFESPLPFTPQVQRHLMRQSSDELKSSENCDTSFSSGTLNAARRAAGAVAHAVDRVMLGRNRNAFCAIRPPGHHSGYRGLLDGSNSCGFCIFNNVAAGALHALEDHQCERVAIVDLDIHHGNGTEDIVRRYQHPSRLLFFSIHLFDSEETTNFNFYPGTGGLDDYVHNIINVPIVPLWKVQKFSSERQKLKTPNSSEKEKDTFIPPVNKTVQENSFVQERNVLSGREGFRQAIIQRLIPSLRAFNPNLIILSAGFDAADGDVGNCKHVPNSPPVKGMDLKAEDFSWATTEIMRIADICCNGRFISVLEGGYGEYSGNNVELKSTGKVTTRQASTNPVRPNEIDANAVKSYMNRNTLAECAGAHVHRLIDPYGPSRTALNQDLI